MKYAEYIDVKPSSSETWREPALWVYRGAAATIAEAVTGEVTVALIATPPSSSGSGAITHELDATEGLIAVPETVAAEVDASSVIAMLTTEADGGP